MSLDMYAPSVSERKRLNVLGYKNADIDHFTPERIKQILDDRLPKPGSKAYIKKTNELLEKAGLPKVDDRFSDEEIAARNAQRPEPSGVNVTCDEFTNDCLRMSQETLEYNGKIIKGSDPLNSKLMELAERFPGIRFRYMHPQEPITSGPEWQTFYDPQTKEKVVNGELTMCFMPEKTHKEGHEDRYMALSRGLTGAIEKNQSDVLRSDGENLSDGKFTATKSEAFHAA